MSEGDVEITEAEQKVVNPTTPEATEQKQTTTEVSDSFLHNLPKLATLSALTLPLAATAIWGGIELAKDGSPVTGFVLAGLVGVALAAPTVLTVMEAGSRAYNKVKDVVSHTPTSPSPT